MHVVKEERRVYQLTEAGQAELAAQAEQVTAFWDRIAGKSVAPAPGARDYHQGAGGVSASG